MCSFIPQASRAPLCFWAEQAAPGAVAVPSVQGGHGVTSAGTLPGCSQLNSSTAPARKQPGTGKAEPWYLLQETWRPQGLQTPGVTQDKEHEAALHPGRTHAPSPLPPGRHLSHARLELALHALVTAAKPSPPPLFPALPVPARGHRLAPAPCAPAKRLRGGRLCPRHPALPQPQAGGAGALGALLAAASTPARCSLPSSSETCARRPRPGQLQSY